ncbi:nicotinate-nucleotide pyrophosphorylase (carboxylating) [Blastomyces silverae]|uniref:Nicotinate-nucleotide pyrophosphorylase [carboxylating] n=1 Tax=Blastomyces silverae TaxID=2060906 RepID=A0A0H1BRZ7_9EURO|nr:nicotinate-nucleotide pyrophosphorylase (carboxylating) [Blastomyces silverae]
MASLHGDLSHLLPLNFKQTITAWLEEDCPSFDYGGFVVGEAEGEAKLLGKSKGVVAGVPFFNEVFSQLGCTVEWKVKEGEPIEPITVCAIVRGPMRKILLGERVALNILARCSGIATKTSTLVNILRSHSWNGILAGTRKTTPGFRLVEKYGILDNHVWACYNKGQAQSATTASIAQAIPTACRSIEEAHAAISAGANIIMLDNFSASEVAGAAKLLKDEWTAKGKPRGSFLVEVSGGLNEGNAASFAAEDVDILSTSSIHQGVGIVDFSLKVSLM